MANNSARNIVPLLINSITSVLVIKFTSFSVWGVIVSYLIISNLAAQLAAWGSKQQLIREFSLEPSKIGVLWNANLQSRFPLLLLVSIIILLLNFPGEIRGLLVLLQFLLFFSRSYEVMIVYLKKMGFFLICETILAILFVGAILLKHQSLSASLILFLFICTEFFRLAVAAIYFRKSVHFYFPIRLDYKILRDGLIFYCLGTLGMLQTRLDLYFVAILLTKDELAVYQVLLNFIILTQAATGYIIQPFLKEIYRMNRNLLSRFSQKFTLYGLIIAIPATLSIGLIMEKIYGISISTTVLVLSFCYIVPIFYYTIRVYILLKIKKEALVLFTGISVLILSLPLNYYLISIFRFTGALSAGVAGEFLSLLFYYYFERRVGLAGGSKKLISQTERG